MAILLNLPVVRRTSMVMIPPALAAGEIFYIVQTKADLATANVLLASGAAMALGIVCLAISTIALLLEARAQDMALSSLAGLQRDIADAKRESDALLRRFRGSQENLIERME